MNGRTNERTNEPSNQQKKLPFEVGAPPKNGTGIITVFNSASTTTLVLQELIKRGELKIRMTGEFQCISGIGGRTKSEVGELTLTRNDGTVVTANVNVVDEILTTKKQSKETLNRLAQYAAQIIREYPEYRDVQADNFQQVEGGRIELLLGQNLRDFFPVTIKNIHGNFLSQRCR